MTTVTLALGVLRMAKRKAIVKKLHSVEALGSVSVICSDKTGTLLVLHFFVRQAEMIDSGTLTRNEQTVTELYTVDELVCLDPAAPSPPAHVSPALRKTLEVGALCNGASIARNENGEYVGQATDVALLNALSVFDLPDPRQVCSLSTLLAITLPACAIRLSSACLNAPLAQTRRPWLSQEHIPPRAQQTAAIASKAQAVATRGLRVIAMAYCSAEGILPSRPSSPSSTNANEYMDKEKSAPLVFVGFVAMYDPPRKGVSDSIALLQGSGVQVVMITGDAEETALSIAKSLGLRGATNPNACLTGAALDRMNASQLSERVGSVSVFARVSPKHKMAIVEAFQARGAVVAMTGDGG